jgi:hypothetical protein
MTKLHQILAVERGVQADADRKVNLALRGTNVEGEASPLFGKTRVYEPREVEGDTLPPETQRVQIRVEKDVLPAITEALTRLFDVKLIRETANTDASADVKIGGTVLLPDVPAGYLLFLENQLTALRGLVQRLPVLDPAEEWHWDGNRNVYVTEQTKKAREIRVPQIQVVQPPQVIEGKTFDGQYRTFETAKPVGDWTTVKMSGALPADKREEILDRITILGEAVKYAREQANSIDVTNRKAGAAVFAYLLDGTVKKVAEH